MTLDRLRRIFWSLVFVAALPIVGGPLGWLGLVLLDLVTIAMGLVLVVSFAWLIGSSWRGTWHT